MATTQIVWSVWILSCVTVASGYYFSYGTQNICNGELVAAGDASLSGCPAPFEEYGGYGRTFTRKQKVTKPATIQKIDVKWFLSSGNPALNVTFNALSSDSAQVYEVTILSETYPTSIFCGHITQPKPYTKRLVLQKLALELRCSDIKIKANEELTVIVQATGGTPNTRPKSKKIELPGCDNGAMRKSKECKEREKRKISFSLYQDGNATVVVLVTKTAYIKQSMGSMVYLTIREKKEGMLGGWGSIGRPKKLFWPQRTARFENLQPGKTYSVVAWRSGELRRSSRTITIKQDIKNKRFNDGSFSKMS